jgi:general secretion pathway protein H
MKTGRATDGFTLLEMLVVLAIFSMAAGVAYNGLSWRKPHESLNTLSQKIAHAAAAASLRAISGGETARLEIDLAKRIVSGGQGTGIAVPEPFKISVLTGADPIEQKRAGAVEFYSDGTSSGGEIKLEENGGKTSSIRIYWLTGAIAVKSGARP